MRLSRSIPPRLPELRAEIELPLGAPDESLASSGSVAAIACEATGSTLIALDLAGAAERFRLTRPESRVANPAVASDGRVVLPVFGESHASVLMISPDGKVEREDPLAPLPAVLRGVSRSGRARVAVVPGAYIVWQNGERLGSVECRDLASGAVQWRADGRLEHATGTRVFLSSMAGQCAIDCANGKAIWKNEDGFVRVLLDDDAVIGKQSRSAGREMEHEPKNPEGFVTSVFADGIGTVFNEDFEGIRVYDPATGALRWRKEWGREFRSVVAGPHVVVALTVGNDADALSARIDRFDPKDGTVIGSTILPREKFPRLQHPFDAVLLAVDSTSILMDYCGVLRSEILADPGEHIWEMPMPGRCWAVADSGAHRSLAWRSFALHEGALLLRDNTRVWIYG